MHILGIETSCDETSAAVSNKRAILSNVTVNQLIHNEYGGVVPEIASREHLSLISKVVDKAIIDSKVSIDKIDAIAVTNGPGLKGALIIGVNFAKGLSLGLNIPIIPINHMEGHLFSNFIDLDEIKYPFLCMLVSGGHTQIWLINSYQDYKLYSTTIDDAAGEAFDKGARILGLGYPGGPEIDNIAKNGDPKFFKFPRPEVKKEALNFSFSGLKTALLYYCQKKDKKYIEKNISHIAASYQEAIIDSILNRIKKVINLNRDIKQIYIAGGVAANSRFRKKSLLCNFNEIDIIFPDLAYCTDNAAMIAMAGYHKIIKGEYSKYNLVPNPNLKL